MTEQIMTEQKENIEIEKQESHSDNSTSHKAHVAQYKKEVVSRLQKLISEYPIIGVVNMENLPTPPLQEMRSKLRGSAVLLMTKRRLIKIALEQSRQSRKGIDNLEQHLSGMPALLFTKDNPFKLSRILKENRSPATAKAGQTAPDDIIVSAGPTPFAPGPIIGELAQLGIKSGVEAGKVAIKQDSVVAKMGDKISAPIAAILSRLGITPMEVGLDLVAAYEGGLVYEKGILNIEQKEYLKRIDNAALWAFNLAFNSHYPTKETLPLLIGRAFRETKAVGMKAKLFEKGIVGELITKAEREMLSLKSSANIPDAPPSETKEEKIEEKIEKKKAEPKEEIKVLSREELEENIKMRDKEKELEEVERLAKEISRKHALGK